MEKNWLLDSVKMTDDERLSLLKSINDITDEVSKKITTGMKACNVIIEVVERRLKLLREGKGNGK